MKTHVSVAAVVAASALVLSACGGGAESSGEAASFTAEPTGTLKAWGFENADDVGTSRLDHAEQQLSDVEIELDASAFDAQKFTTRVASGDVPDVVQMDRSYVASYAAQDLIQPLTDCYAAWDVDPDEAYYPWVADNVRYDGEIWAVPQFYQPLAIMLDTRVLDKAGVAAEDIDTSDLDTLLPAIEKVYQESGGNPSVLGLDPVAGGNPEIWILGQGGTLAAEDGSPALDTPENATALENLKQITDAQGGYAKLKSFSESFDMFGDNNQFVKDQVGAQLNAQWYPNVLTPYADQIEISTVPFRGPDGQPFTVASGTAFVVPAGAKNPSAGCAWALKLTELDAWLAAGKARAATLEETGATINSGLFTGSPEADQQIRDLYVKETGNAGFDETIAGYYETLEFGASPGSSPVGQQIREELINAMTSVLLGDKDAETALADAQANVERAYEQVASD